MRCRSGYTALHMAVRGTAEAVGAAGRDVNQRAHAERRGKAMAAFLLSQDAFVDSLDKLCRSVTSCVKADERYIGHHGGIRDRSQSMTVSLLPPAGRH